MCCLKKTGRKHRSTTPAGLFFTGNTLFLGRLRCWAELPRQDPPTTSETANNHALFLNHTTMRMLAFTMATLLFGRAGAESLTVAMAHIKDDAGFNPKEPPKHKTDIKVGLYLEHLLDVRAPPHDPHS